MNVRQTLEQCLRGIWTTVTPLGRGEASMVLAEFNAKCVREEFRKKFVNSFDKEKPITVRFFEHATEVDVQQKLCGIFGSVQANVEATLFLGPLNDPVAFTLRGQASRLNDIFMTDDDAFAKISMGTSTKFFFFDGNREKAFVCSS